MQYSQSQFTKDVRYSPKRHFLKRQLPQSTLARVLGPYSVVGAALGPYPVVGAALGPHCSLRRVRRSNLNFGKLHIWKLPLLNLILGKIPNTAKQVGYSKKAGRSIKVALDNPGRYRIWVGPTHAAHKSEKYKESVQYEFNLTPVLHAMYLVCKTSLETINLPHNIFMKFIFKTIKRKVFLYF